jgi:hypothetical protein
MSEIEN